MQLYQKLKQTLSRWLDVGTINPERDEALMPVLMLWVERLAILVVAIVSGIAVAAYGYLLASGYTSLIWVRYLSSGVFFALATAITDIGVKYFIQKGAFDFFAAFNPRTYKDSKANWCDVVIIAAAGLLTFACFHYCEVEKFIKDDVISSEWGRIAARYIIKVLLFCIFIPISELSIKSFFQVKESGRYTWFQRSMQVVVWGCMVGIIGGMFYFDYISVDSVRRPVANMVKQEKQLNQDSLREIVLAQEKTRVGATAAAIQSAQAEIRRLEREVKAVEKRVESKNGSLARLIAQHNGWAAGQLEAKKNSATASIRRQIERENENLSFLREQQGKELAYSSTVVARSDSATLATNAAIAGRNTDLVTGTSTMFIWLGFWAKCIAGIIRILLVAMFLAGNIQDYNKDGQVNYKDVTAAAPLGFQPG